MNVLAMNRSALFCAGDVLSAIIQEMNGRNGNVAYEIIQPQLATETVNNRTSDNGCRIM